ncbi:MAG: nucleotide-binding protein [Gammaproteobacteria bacterium]|nr:MAG: nucleotide-binding protein [Gammaproteobacteria bacterium]
MSTGEALGEETGSVRYSIGIDLGTTNNVLSFVDLQSDEDNPVHSVFSIPQLTAPGVVEEHPQLPSFLYQAHESELNEADRVLPWSNNAEALVGYIARSMGSKTPLRLVASAKSWLCHGGVDRRSGFLPLNSPDEIVKVSPFDATVRYLEHLRGAWNHQYPDALMQDQDVTITIPASFDPAARELTAEAAKAIGLQHLTLLEEPQAAVYSWVKALGDEWREQLQVGDIVLVVDVGGGTTDLSLVAVTEEEGNLALNRIAVGDHILLGGDNMDLALAYRINAKLNAEGKQLQPWQIQALTHGCRDAKEQLLSDSHTESVPLVVPSRGSKLLGATLRTELTRQDVEETLVDGFFPYAGVEEQPVQQPRGALTQMGLPYAQDAGITRHLAAFLSRHSGAADGLLSMAAEGFIKPTAILLNGGVLKAPVLSERLMSVINGWLVASGAQQARLLSGADLDLAVAKGASYFGSVKRGKGVRIRGGIANAYYVGIESAMPAVPGMPPQMQALCVAPFGMEEGTNTEVHERTFGLVIGEPVRFQFYGSAVRREDQAGTLLDFWQPEELESLPDIEVTLPTEGREAGQVVPVYLAASVTEIGTLKLEAVSVENSHRWQVEFEVRTN